MQQTKIWYNVQTHSTKEGFSHAAFRCPRRSLLAVAVSLLPAQIAAACALADAARQTPTPLSQKMKRLIAIALLCVSTSCAVAAIRSPQFKVVSLEQLHSQPTLIGQEIEVVSCAGIPLTDASNQEDLIIIYPCGTKLSEEASEMVALGRLSVQTVLKPSKEWAIGDSAAFKGRFRGVLKREAIDPNDKEKVLVIELSEAEFYSAVD